MGLEIQSFSGPKSVFGRCRELCLGWAAWSFAACFPQDVAEVALRGCRSHQSNKSSAIPPKVIKFLSKLLKITQYSQGKQTGSL